MLNGDTQAGEFTIYLSCSPAERLLGYFALGSSAVAMNKVEALDSLCCLGRY